MKSHLPVALSIAAIAAVLPFANFEVASSLVFTAGFLTIFFGDYQSRRALRRVDYTTAGVASIATRRTASRFGLAA